MGCPHSKQQKVVVHPTETETVTVLGERDRSPQDVFQDSIKYLVKENLYSDLTIICGDDRYPVHRAIVCLRSRWFTEKCLDFEYESAPPIIYMGDSEDPYMIAALLTYFYTFDYADEGPQMAFGLPEDHIAKSLGAVDIGHATLPNCTEENEAPLIEWEEPESDSEFDFAPNTNLALDVLGNFEGAKSKDDEWETLSKSSTARRTPSPCHCSHTKQVLSPVAMDRDPAKPIGPLALHVQMCKAGFRFGIPCLVAYTFRKLENTIRQNEFGDEQLLEAASHAWEFGDDDHVVMGDHLGSLGRMRTVILAQMKARWESIRVLDGFEKLVMWRPEFGRDVLRVM